MLNTFRIFGVIMCYHHQGFIFAAAKGVNYVFHQSAVIIVKTMQRLIKNKQLWVFDESAR